MGEILADNAGALITGSVAIVVLVATLLATNARERRLWQTSSRRDAYQRFFAAAEDVLSIIRAVKHKGSYRGLDADAITVRLHELQHAYGAARLVASEAILPVIRNFREQVEAEFNTKERDAAAVDRLGVLLDDLLRSMRADLHGRRLLRT